MIVLAVMLVMMMLMMALCRKMFLLQYALEVKMGEKNRLETTLKEEETRVRRMMFMKKK